MAHGILYFPWLTVLALTTGNDDRFSLVFEQGTLLLSGCNSVAIAKIFESDIWTWDSRVAAWRCDAIRYREVAARLQLKASWADVHAAEFPDVHWQSQNIHPLRPEQRQAIQKWLETRRGVIVMPTGTGKTEVALHLMQKTSCSTLVVAPVRDLMYQWHRRIQSAFNYDAGIIGDNTFNIRPVSVTTYDSASIHAARLGNQFKLIVFDECHHLPGEFRREAAMMSIAPWRLGLTATPERSDGRHHELDFLIGPVVYELTIDAVKGKSLADFDVIRIPIHLSSSEQSQYNECSTTVRTFMHERRQVEPDFRWQDLCNDAIRDPHARQAMVAYRRKQAIEDRASEKLRVLEDLFRLHAGTPMLVFVGSNAMARDLSIRFLIPCLLSHCGKRERHEILDGLQNGVYPALVANQVLDEGVDVPAVKIAVVVGGSASTKQAKQRLGRVLRRSGNARAILYEIVCQDTSENLRSRRRRKSDAYAGTRHRRV